MSSLKQKGKLFLEKTVEVLQHPYVRKASRFARMAIETASFLDLDNPLSIAASALSMVDTATEAFELPQPTKVEQWAAKQGLVESFGFLSTIVVSTGIVDKSTCRIVCTGDGVMLREMKFDFGSFYFVEGQEPGVYYESEFDRIHGYFYTTPGFPFNKLFDRMWEKFDQGIYLSINSGEEEFSSRSMRLNKLSTKVLSYIGAEPNLEKFVEELRKYRESGISRSYMFAGNPGTGKAQPLYSRILTPEGWTTMGELKIGDRVVSQDGRPTAVSGIFPQGERDVYRVTFSDGSSTDCCEEHLWTTASKYDRVANRFRVRTLKEIMDSGLNTSSGHKVFSIPTVSPVEFSEKTVAIDPYLMGCLIGDGCFRNTSLGFSTEDSFILEKLSGLIGKLEIRHKSKNNPGSCDYRFAGKQGSLNWIIQELKRLGMYGKLSLDKGIPETYKFGSVNQRIELLRGLMDTDGTVDKHNGCPSFSTSSETLANDFVDLVNSLGGIARKRNKPTKCAMNYIINVSLPPSINPFHLPRKSKLIVPKTKYQPTRYIESVELVGRMPVQCIMVDSHYHTYLTDSYIVTHNTSFSVQTIKQLGGRLVKIDPTVATIMGGAELEFVVRNLQPDAILFDDFDNVDDPEKLFFTIENIKQQFPQIVVFATVNHFDDLDPAIKRPGRFDQTVWFHLPQEKERDAVISYYFKEFGIEISRRAIKDLVRKSQGLSQAYLRELCVRVSMRGIGCAEETLEEFARTLASPEDMMDIMRQIHEQQNKDD